MGPALKAEIPEIEDATRIKFIGEIMVRQGKNTFFENRVVAVDPSLFHMFSFPLIKGNAGAALADPYSIILSEATAGKYFGHADPIGKVLTVDNRLDFTVTGIMKNVPGNSSLQFDIAVPYELLRSIGRRLDSWTVNTTITFVLLGEDAVPQIIVPKIHSLLGKHTSTEGLQFSLLPLTDIHLYSHSGFGNKRGNAQYVTIFSAIAVFVLLIACINFMNLSTARSSKRAREVGMRKVVGAMRTQIVKQFYGESCLFIFISLVISLVIVWLALPVFNVISGKSISIGMLVHGYMPLAVMGILLITGIFAGSYPALFLAAFHPVKVLKGVLSSGPSHSTFRKILVVVQFSLSIFLIIGTGIVSSQLQYIKQKNVGFEKAHLISIPMRGSVGESYESLRKELLKRPGVMGVSAGSDRPSLIRSNSDGADWEGIDPQKEISVYFTSVDYDYIETADMEMAEGRSYSRDHPSDVEAAFVINEELQKLMGFESAVGKRFSFGGKTGSIVGVVKNFHFLSLKKKIEPLVLQIPPEILAYMLIRIHPGNISTTMEDIENTWSRVVPEFPFDFKFINEEFDALYRSEERMEDVLRYFAFLAVLIACLGLFGLASFAAEQRTKEFGIRKVLGASMSRITVLLCREFTILVILANVIAWPVAYLIMRNWLSGFAYRTSISWEVFAGAAGLALVISLVTISYQAIKSALINPARALKYE
jgi:ABC-type antimicrobial peptide transport system permease subunit